MSIVLREWQKKLHEVVYERTFNATVSNITPVVRVDACVGSGKSTAMAYIAHDLTFGELAEFCPIDFHVFVAPNRLIVGDYGGAQGDEAYGIIGALLHQQIYPTTNITPERYPGHIPPQDIKATDANVMTGMAAVFTYQYVLNPRVQDTLLAWQAAGKRIAVHYDEKHHIPAGNSSWTKAVECLNRVAVFRSSWSGTWFRTDRQMIKDQVVESEGEPDFVYSYADALRDGHVRPLSFLVRTANALSIDKDTGVIINERPVSEYIEKVPKEVRETMLHPEGEFVGRMIEAAEKELTIRRTKYRNAGCLVICPPGFTRDGATPDDDEEQDRLAVRLHQRIIEQTGKRARLLLNNDPSSGLSIYRESDEEYLVAVNRISEGCDIPRLRMALILRDLSGSELMFQQIIGRIIRRQPDDDIEPALAILPPFYQMAEYGREIYVQAKHATPKIIPPCPTCDRLPCACPCRRCGNRRPCKCPCWKCGERPCVCRQIEELNYYIALEGTTDIHMHHGTEIHDSFAQRAENIRNKPASPLKDIAMIGFVLQLDEEVNGQVPRQEEDEHKAPFKQQAIKNFNTRNLLKTQVEAKAKQFSSRYFPEEENPFRSGWNYLNKRVLDGQKWSQMKDDPALMTIALLEKLNVFLDEKLSQRRR